MNPYSDAKPYQMWRRAVARIEPHLVDPVVTPRFQLATSTRVGTAGSCFAQHIAKKIAEIGFNYLITESGDDLSHHEKVTRQFGVYSARYGNLYTPAQLSQLLDECFEGREFSETAWQRPDGRFVDPYRPQIEPVGFSSPDEVVYARKEHLEAARRVFRESEVFIFTLGLTESWRSKVDGAVFPLAPGVVAGSFDPEKHEFHNYSVRETTKILGEALDKLKNVNPDIKVLLTVSPVPLIATYEDRHILASTTYSKAVLRIAAQEYVEKYDWVDYFPSFEIITASSTGGMYFESDYREVSPLGVAHAMRCFVRNYTSGAERVEIEEIRDSRPERKNPGTGEMPAIICDEEAIDAVNI
ncbi:GSCFA domain-containing protein [Neorhizobium lilium]|uniref:GSCFA domain-containing protein n=1 Tax=Neorhizobium lilium TaxID=2503024 RepID=UPI001FE0995F|nr:GSCFA domain-containing protein [Neorhizobium lilium]